MSVGTEMLRLGFIAVLMYALLKATGGTRQAQLEQRSARVQTQELMLGLKRSPIPKYAVVTFVAITGGMWTYFTTALALVIVKTEIAVLTGLQIPIYPWLLICGGAGVYVAYFLSHEFEPWPESSSGTWS